MDHLSLLAGTPDKANHRPIRHLGNAANSSQATSCSVRLQNSMHLLWCQLTTIVERVKALSKSLLTAWAEKALGTFACVTVFVGFFMTA